MQDLRRYRASAVLRIPNRRSQTSDGSAPGLATLTDTIVSARTWSRTSSGTTLREGTRSSATRAPGASSLGSPRPSVLTGVPSPQAPPNQATTPAAVQPPGWIATSCSALVRSVPKVTSAGSTYLLGCAWSVRSRRLRPARDTGTRSQPCRPGPRPWRRTCAPTLPDSDSRSRLRLVGRSQVAQVAPAMERVVHRLLRVRPDGLSHLEREPGRGDKRVGAHVDRAAGELAEVIGTHSRFGNRSPASSRRRSRASARASSDEGSLTGCPL